MKDLWRSIAVELDCPIPAPHKLQEIHDTFEKDFIENLGLFPTVEMTLSALRERGLPLGIISDGDSLWQWKKLHSTGIDRFFEKENVCISIQSDLYSCKPSSANFRIVEERFNLLPHQLIYVGDKPWDILAANAAGWYSVFSAQSYDGDKERITMPQLNIEEPDRTIKTLSEILELVE
jgi:HAD superfamily hydrolase (TIGR01509 family)